MLILPPATLGIIGGGQLGRMFTISAKQMGYKVALLEPDIDCPASHFADFHIKTAYDDITGLTTLAKLAQVVTTEFENVPAASFEALTPHIPIYPNPQAIAITQNRLKEKELFRQLGINTVAYARIATAEDTQQVDLSIFPAILKTNTLGYDGKGQIIVDNKEQLIAAFNQLHQVECILEKKIDLKLEVSLITARNHFESVSYAIGHNEHHNGILDTTTVPAAIGNDMEQQITRYGKAILEHLQYIGVLAIEFFITQDNQIIANEMAPRPHNSGHHTIDACYTSQFEQQVRAICNLPLGNPMLHTPCIMLNLLGDSWINETTPPDFSQIFKKHPNIKLHLYEKKIARQGRKMGHLTLLGNDTEQLKQEIAKVKHYLA
jgi:5-(carboxyamino)imidazole ribonucleotide synthase